MKEAPPGVGASRAWEGEDFGVERCFKCTTTRTQLAHHKVLNEDVCMTYSSHSETIEHVSRDFPLAVAVWFSQLDLRISGSNQLAFKSGWLNLHRVLPVSRLV
ncbi:hypothetical protein FF2_024786 [Malus domestica]